MQKKIKVLIVDDSNLICQMLTEMLGSDPELEVVGIANDPFEARERIKSLKPDVITLDVEMPRMDGITFLSNLMRLHPMPVVMVSSLTEKGADVTLRALELGAIDFVTKPRVNVAGTLNDYKEEITAKVKMAARVPLQRMERQFQTHTERNSRPAPIVKKPISSAEMVVPPKLSADVILANRGASGVFSRQPLIALGASTGGTEAIRDVLAAMPENSPAMVITQHIPAAFSGPFAKRMDSISAMTVHEAEDGQVILPGHVYIAPGSHHLLVESVAGKLVCRLNDGPAVNRHKPSVDVMFRSVAQVVGPNAFGVILTGMGDDGAKGLKELQSVKAPTIAQDEKTSVVWGMPGEAVKLNAADFVLPLSEVAQKLLKLSKINSI
jgi:two-component system chemotaxis response regulator CheB